MKIAKKIDMQRMECLRKKMHRPEYQKRAIQVIALGLAEALMRKNSDT